MNETSLTGSANEVKDTAGYTGGPFDGQSTRLYSSDAYPTPSSTSRAISGAPGTCGYVTFSANNAIQLDGLPVSTTNGDKTSVSFWMYWNGTNNISPIGWNFYNLRFVSNYFGFNTEAGDMYGIDMNTTPLANGWHHVVAVFTNGSVTSNKIFIDGASKTLSTKPFSGIATTSALVVQSTLQISGWTSTTTQYRFANSRVDEVKIYKGEVTQAQVDEAYNETYQCAGETVALLPAVDNLALTANVTTSFVSSWENLEGVNDNVTPTTSYVYHLGTTAGVKTYGNWANFGTTQWVSFDWPTNKQLTSFQVFWWSDEFIGGAVLQPTTAYVEYWDGSAWQSLGNIGTNLHTFNNLAINNIVTKKIRVSMSSAKATGITEVRIFGRETPSLIASYNMDELSWNGTNGEVLDSSGNGYNATAKIKSGSTLPNTANSSRAYGTTTNGTCGYGVFTGTQYIDIPSTFPNLTNSMSFSAWIKTTDRTTTQRIIADDQNNNGGYILSLSNGTVGAIKFEKRNTTTNTYVETPAVISNNTWYFVAASVDSSSSQVTIYVYDQSGTQLNKTTGSISNLTNTDAGTASIGDENLSSSEALGFKGNIDEVSVYSGALYQTEIDAIRASTHACPSYVTNANASSFNCIATQEASVNAGKLYTQLVGNSFGLKVTALKSTGAAETSFSSASYKDVTLKFLDQNNANSAITFNDGTTNATSTTVRFPTGDTTGILAVSNLRIDTAYKNLVCQITDANQAPTKVALSSDNFTVRPQSLTLSTNVTNPSVAGNNFTLTATGGTGYNGAPKLLVSNISTMQSNMLTNTSNLSVSDTQYNAFTAGTGAATLILRYHDIGSINFYAGAVLDDGSISTGFTNMDYASSDCVAGSASNTAVSGKYGCNIASTALAAVGRFKPDHFTATTNTLSGGCSAGGFTYMSQPNLTLNTVIEAQSAQNIASKSYNTGTLSYAVRNSSTAITASRLQKSGITWAPSSTWTNGALTLSESTLSYVKSTSADGPYDNFNINYSISDSLGDSIAFSGNAYTNDTKIRYGRLNIQNAYGSELLPLAVPIEAQYWNGTAYQRNQLDTCTAISPTNISMGNFKSNLTACETQISGSGTMVQGKTTATLSKPGTGNNGSVDVTVNLASVGASPNDKTCTSSTQSAASATGYSWFGGTNPTSRATFGLFKSPVIYMRENY